MVLSEFPIKSNPVFTNDLKSLPKNPPDSPILCNWVFDNFILTDELFAKALQNLEICVLVKDNLWRILFSSLESPTKFAEIFTKLLQFHFLFLILIYQVVNYTILRLKCYIQ